MADLTQAVTQAALARGIDPRWALATMQTESGGDPNAVSSAGAIGPMQLIPSTAAGLGVNPYDPQQNVQGGVALLAQNLRRYGNPEAASAAYFGGTDPSKWGPKTRQYVATVEKNYKAMQQQDDGFAAFSKAMSDTGTGNAPSIQSAAPAQDDGFQAFSAQMSDAGTQSGAGSAAAPAAPSLGQQVIAGAERGIHVLTDRPAEALASVFGQGQQVRAGDQQAAQAYQQQYGNAKPFSPVNIANVGTQLAGGAAMLAGGEGVANALAEGTRLGPAVAYLTGRGGQTLLGRAGSLALQGAGQTAAMDAATGRQITPTQIALGAALNPLAAGAASGVSNVVGGAARSLLTPEEQAGRMVLNAGAADRGIPAQFAGPGDTLATTAGPNVRGLAESLVQQPGPGQDIVTGYFKNLMEQQPQVLAQAVKGAMGSDGKVGDLVQTVMQQRSAQAAPLFERAFNTPISEQATTKLQAMLDAPRAQDAVKTALQNLQDEAEANGAQFNPADYGVQIGADGKAQLIPGANSTPFLAAVKEGFDDNIEGMRDPTSGRLPNTKQVNNLDTIRANFRQAVVDANPDYGSALDAWSGPSRAIDAARLGQKVFSTDTDTAAQRVAQMDKSEKAAYQAGVAQAILNKIGQVQDGGKVARMFATPNVRAKVEAAFDSPQDAQSFMDMAERLNEQANARNAIMGNSRTAARQAQQGYDWGAAAAAGRAALAGNPIGAAMNLLRGVPARGMSDETSIALANLLTNPNAAQVAAAIQAARPGVAPRAGNALAGAAARMLGLTPSLLGISGGGMAQ